MLIRSGFILPAVIVALLAMIAAVACGSTETVEVTRLVEVEKEVTRVERRQVPVTQIREVEVTRVVTKVVEREVRVTHVVEVEVEPPAGPKETVIFGDLNWASALLQNRIAQYILEFGYGYPTDVKFGGTLPLFEGLKKGDTHVAMEIWLPNLDEAWEKARADGAVLSVGKSLGQDWQSAFVIPAYLQEQYPELDSVEDLKEQQYKDLFKTRETGDKARLVSCVIGWACEGINTAQVEAYGLAEHVEVVAASDAVALSADLYGAYEKGKPWLGYQWGTNAPSLSLDLVRLEEPPYSDQCWFTTKACAYEDSTVLIAVNPDLPAKAPDVVEMLRRWDFNVNVYKTAVRWQLQNGNPNNEATALWWLNANQEIWSQWVTDEAETAILSALADGKEPEGWPGD